MRGTHEPSEFPLGNKLAVSHLRAAVLDEYQVESSSLGKGRNFLVFCAALQLRNPLLALRLQLLLLRALLQVLELDDVAVWNVAVVRAFREQEEIAVAVRHLQLGARDELRKVSHLALEVALQTHLAAYAAAYRSGLGKVFGHELEELAPLALVGECLRR